MKIEIWSIGKTKANYLKAGEDIYLKRLKNYCAVEMKLFKEPKVGKSSAEQIKKAEAEIFFKQILPDDYIILLDEKGKQTDSSTFASQLQKWFNQGPRRIIFIIGGAWGFDESIMKRSNFELSLSKMTFTHQMVRLIFLEQLYRAFTILKNEPYHNN